MLFADFDLHVRVFELIYYSTIYCFKHYKINYFVEVCISIEREKDIKMIRKQQDKKKIINYVLSLF